MIKDEVMLDRTALRGDASIWTSSSANGVVTSAHYRASEAGASVLSTGGNAIDAAIATSLALGVVEPAASGLGGMAMMMVHLKAEDRTFILKGPCRAPVNARPEDILKLVDEYKKDPANHPIEYNDEEIAGRIRRDGYRSVAVPTYPAVMAYALERYGTFAMDVLLEPAIRLAEDGYLMSPFQNGVFRFYRSQLRKGNAHKVFFAGQDEPPAPGTRVRQPVLANTLRRLSEQGFKDFYTGSIADEIAYDMKVNGGYVSKDDLRNIPWPEETEPLRGRFMDMEIRTMPPPGGGTVLIEMLNIFEAMVTDGFDPDSPEAALLFATIMRRARSDRRRSFQSKKAKLPDLIDKGYARQVAEKLGREILGGETTHLNVIDKDGNVVALTQSIERSFGSKVMTPSLGFLYNGFMKAFKLKNKKHPHYLRPGAVARSNATPTILFRKGEPVYAIGSTGSERMASGMFQVLVRLLSQDSFEAVKAPRLHCTPEREVFLEAERFHPGAIELLKDKGFGINAFTAWDFSAGGLHLAGIDNGKCWGVAEPRRDGASLGPEEVSRQMNI
ncbi:MAG: gamma-glutamyltransferase [Nitrospirota bacterium]|nr:MAG: gamma-glutamyltransferase [Nitrospirota bacterium]